MSFTNLASKVSKLYFLQIGNVDADILEFIASLSTPFKITKTDIDYGKGWTFKNNESLQELYKTIDEQFDWVLYPDADDLLPDDVLNTLNKASILEADTVRFHFIECFTSPDKIIAVKEGFPIGPHFKAVIHSPDINFIDSPGFNQPTGVKRWLETEDCVRHLRYATPEAVARRREMNYYEDFFSQDHELIDFVEGESIDYYKR